MTKERPILFSAPMVRAILAGTKTQTRRLVKWPIYSNGTRYDRGLGDILCHNDYLPPSAMLMEVRRGKTSYVTSNLEAWEHECPYGEPGDRLWVRETWSPDHRDVYPCIPYVYRASASFSDDEAREHRFCDFEKTGVRHFECLACAGFKWRPSIHMPRSVSRITLEITDVRVERLQSISDSDAKAEGVAPAPFCKSSRPAGQEHVEAFEDLWDSINLLRAPWSSNPWVWALSFRRSP